MTGIGHNNPPSQIEFCRETVSAISSWMQDNPVIEDDIKAREAKVLVDRAKGALKEMEDERDSKVRPLNQQVKEINDSYRSPRDDVNNALTLILERINGYIQAEEAKRIEAARRAQQELDKKIREAEEKERLARQAAADAKEGVVVDVVSSVRDAEKAFKEFTKAERVAARAAKDTHVQIGGGFGRKLSQRTKETLAVTDPIAALNDIGFTEGLLEAILTEARAFRSKNGRLPNGVVSHKSKEL